MNTAIKNVVKKLLVFFIFFSLSGCTTLGYKQFYDQVAPRKYPPTKKVIVFEYSNVDLNEIYELLFNDFLVIGKASFNGPYEDPLQSISYAKSIGADVFLTASQFKETKTSFMPITSPTTSTTYICGYSGRGSAYGTATTYGTQTNTIQIDTDRYDQVGMYLKNINDIIPLWERKRQDYKKTGSSTLAGIWHNEKYELDIFKSGEQIVAFITSRPRGNKYWDIDQLKMIFGDTSGVGIYLMSNKMPMPAEFKLNKFGHLEIKLFTTGDVFSFARKQ